MTFSETTGDLCLVPVRSAAQLNRFPRRHRGTVTKLAASSRRIEDLAESFPALLFALSTGYADPQQSEIALLLVRGGAPLRDVAALIGLPWWTRRLPPECLIDRLDHLPDGATFSFRIVNLVPTEPSEASAWFARVMLAYQTVGEAYALWIARQKRFPAGVAGDISESLLAAWAWYSMHPETAAHAVVRAPWSDGISLRRALDEAKAWSQRIDLAAALGSGIEDTWFPAGSYGSYDFVPLVRLDDFLSESAAMNNCLDQFADHIKSGRTRVFSIRKANRIVADIEIGAHDDDCSVPRIIQLRGPRNRRAGPEIWQAALSWLASQTFRPLPRSSETIERPRRQQLIRAIWRPLMDSVKGTPIEKRVQALAFGKEISRSYRAFQQTSAIPGESSAVDVHLTPGEAAFDGPVRIGLDD